MTEKPLPEAHPLPEAPKDPQARLEEAQELIAQFQEQIFVRFKDYVLSIALLAPRKEDEGRIPVLVLIDDVESKKLAKEALREKLIKIFDEEAAKIDKKLLPEILLLTELWQYCYDSKHEVLQDLATSQPVYDTGVLQSVRLAEIHKQLVLQKFEKYIMCYVLGGSLVQGTATTKSDVDVFMVIDDTDVKKMTRTELRDKLRAIITDLGFQAGDMVGVKNKINIQTYILTDFWEHVKEANPIIFTFLRDGVPFFDKGVFMPWKQLLEMGKVKPSQEAIDLYMSSGDQYLARTKLKLKEIGMEDFFWATTTPAQAAIMLYGHPPPTPKELAGAMRELFVNIDKPLLQEKTVKIVEHIIKVRKDMEHGDKIEITGKEIDDLHKQAQTFLKDIQPLFEKIQAEKDAKTVTETYEHTVTLIRDVLNAEKISHGKDVLKTFDTHIIKKGKLPERFSRILEDIFSAHKKSQKEPLTRAQTQELAKNGAEFYKVALEYLQRKRGRELEKAKVRVEHGEALAEITVLKTQALVVRDVKQQQKQYGVADINAQGGLGVVKELTAEEYEELLAKAAPPEKVVLKDAFFTSITTHFGKDATILYG